MPRIFSCPHCGFHICWSEEVLTSYPGQVYGRCSGCKEEIHSYVGNSIQGHWDSMGEVMRLDGIVQKAEGSMPAVIRVGEHCRCSRKSN